MVDWILDPLSLEDRTGFHAFVSHDGKHGKPLYCSIMDAADDITYWTCNGFVPVTYFTMPPWLRTRAG